MCNDAHVDGVFLPDLQISAIGIRKFVERRKNVKSDEGGQRYQTHRAQRKPPIIARAVVCAAVIIGVLHQ